MSWSAEQNAIAGRFAAHSTIATLDWSAFNLEEATKPSPLADTVWARLSVRSVPGSGRPLGMGPTAPSRRDGLIYVQHFAPTKMGEAALSAAVDETLGIFHRQQFSGVRCHDADPPDRVMVSSSQGWWQVNVVVPYHVEEFPSDVIGTFLDSGEQDFVQSGHALVAGDAVRRSSGSWVKAVASADTTLAEGVVIAVAGDRLTVSGHGFQYVDHGLGSSGKVYLSQGTAGLLTTTAPTTGWIQQLGIITASNQLLLNVGQGVLA